MKSNQTIHVIDAGIGNIGSVVKMIRYVGASAVSTSDIRQLNSASKIILPGVGQFDYGIKSLQSIGVDRDFLNKVVSRNIPILGICLGMQLLCKSSEEGTSEGLGLVDAHVEKFSVELDGTIKVPHMGWNNVRAARSNPLIQNLDLDQRFYFVHSYKVVAHSLDIPIGYTTHGSTFCSAFQHGSVYGVQFHPEKSHRFGMNLFKNFVDL